MSAIDLDSIAEGLCVPSELLSADRKHLLAGACSNCGVCAFPPPRQCPKCLGELSEHQLSTEGQLYSYSVVTVGGAGSPYIVGYVDLPDGARVFGRLPMSEADELLLDMTVELDILNKADGSAAVMWVPATESEHGVR